MKLLRTIAGHVLFHACTVVDHIPCYERASERWYWSQWGCRIGLSTLAFEILPEDDE